MILNFVWLGFFLSAFVAAAVHLALGDLTIFPKLLSAMFDAAKTGFDISIGLVGILGAVAGLDENWRARRHGRCLCARREPGVPPPVPGVPRGHPAQGAMTMNISANLLELDNAATPLGLKASGYRRSTTGPTPPTRRSCFWPEHGGPHVPTSVIAIRQTMAVKQGLVGFNAADIFLPRWWPRLARCCRP